MPSRARGVLPLKKLQLFAEKVCDDLDEHLTRIETVEETKFDKIGGDIGGHVDLTGHNLNNVGEMNTIGTLTAFNNRHIFDTDYRLECENPAIRLFTTGGGYANGKIGFGSEQQGDDAFVIQVDGQKLKVGSDDGGIDCGATTIVRGADELFLQAPEIFSDGNFMPLTNNTFDLGNPNQRWKNGYFGGTIHTYNLNASNKINTTSLTCVGDMEVSDSNSGLVLYDRATGQPYRIYVSNGQLGIEPVG
ncbi:MAG: hypothetical protein QW175_02805 [Candidatus Bathyarchaeia archaeon]